MKKIYQTPSYEVMEIEYPQMLAASDKSANYGGNNENINNSSNEEEVIIPTAPKFFGDGIPEED